MIMNAKRRLFLKGSMAAASVGLAVTAGLLSPRTVLAEWNAEAFGAESLDAALQNGFGSTALEDSDKIELDLPDLAENGASVPVRVTTTLDGAETISVLAAKNPTPLAARYDLGDGGVRSVAMRVKLGQTGEVIGLVQANGKLYVARRDVKVTAGGCGG